VIDRIFLYGYFIRTYVSSDLFSSLSFETRALRSRGPCAIPLSFFPLSATSRSIVGERVRQRGRMDRQIAEERKKEGEREREREKCTRRGETPFILEVGSRPPRCYRFAGINTHHPDQSPSHPLPSPARPLCQPACLPAKPAKSRTESPGSLGWFSLSLSPLSRLALLRSGRFEIVFRLVERLHPLIR